VNFKACASGCGLAESSGHNLVSSQFQGYKAQASSLDPFITAAIYTRVTGGIAHSCVPCSLCNLHSLQLCAMLTLQPAQLTAVCHAHFATSTAYSCVPCSLCNQHSSQPQRLKHFLIFLCHATYT
jgi:hypothetical protein